MTIFYRKLATVDAEPVSPGNVDAEALMNIFFDAFYNIEQLTHDYKARLADWFARYFLRLQQDGTPVEIRRKNMNAVNPNYVLRNYLAQLAIDDAEQGNFRKVNDLLELLRHPYDERPGKENYAAKRPDWARQRAGCSMLSCSS